MNAKDELLLGIDRLHTTPLGVRRIKKNLCLDVDNVTAWCRQKIEEPACCVTRGGKNWYAAVADCKITINAHSYTIITAHKV